MPEKLPQVANRGFAASVHGGEQVFRAHLQSDVPSQPGRHKKLLVPLSASPPMPRQASPGAQVLSPQRIAMLQSTALASVGSVVPGPSEASGGQALCEQVATSLPPPWSPQEQVPQPSIHKEPSGWEIPC